MISFRYCRVLGATREAFNHHNHRWDSSRTHMEQINEIRKKNAEWRQWRTLNDALSDGIPEPVM